MYTSEYKRVCVLAIESLEAIYIEMDFIPPPPPPSNLLLIPIKSLPSLDDNTISMKRESFFGTFLFLHLERYISLIFLK